MKITASQFSVKFQVPLSKVRRNIKEFLPKSKGIYWRCGITRELTLREAQAVFIGTIFVQNLGLTFAEARKHIKIVFRSVRNKKNKDCYRITDGRFYEKSIDVKKALTHVKEKIKEGE